MADDGRRGEQGGRRSAEQCMACNVARGKIRATAERSGIERSGIREFGRDGDILVSFKKG